MNAERIAIAVAFAFACAADVAWAQDPVPIRVVVQQLDRGTPVPLARVSGFTILRNDTPFTNAVCPDASDSRGELTCMLTCAPASKNATLLLMPPRREMADVVAGMKVPPARELKVADCKIATPQPVVLVYKTVNAQLAELEAASPAVYTAATTVANGEVRIKPFTAASPVLEQLAAKAENRRAIRALGEMGRLAAERRTTPASSASIGGAAVGGIAVDNVAPSAGLELADYAVGTRSVLLKAQTADVMGAKTAKDIVKLSPKPTDLNKSIENVTKVLAAKPVVNQAEAQLERAAKECSGRSDGTDIVNTPSNGGEYGQQEHDLSLVRR